MKLKEFRKILKGLKVGSVVSITDYRDYDYKSCNTGGAYSYTESYKKLENGKFEVEYSTSSVFNYCPFCGQFINGECNCYEEYEQISIEVLAAILKYCWKDQNFEIIFNKNLQKTVNWDGLFLFTIITRLALKCSNLFLEISHYKQHWTEVVSVASAVSDMSILYSVR